VLHPVVNNITTIRQSIDIIIDETVMTKEIVPEEIPLPETIVGEYYRKRNRVSRAYAVTRITYQAGRSNGRILTLERIHIIANPPIMLT
jgi:hypothetical protein